MLSYILRRLAYGLLVMVLVVVTISSIIFLAPVDPAQLTFGQRSDVSTVKAKTAELGLDQPLYIQMAHYLADLSPVSVLANNIENKRKYRFYALFPWGDQQSRRPEMALLARILPTQKEARFRNPVGGHSGDGITGRFIHVACQPLPACCWVSLPR